MELNADIVVLLRLGGVVGRRIVIIVAFVRVDAVVVVAVVNQVMVLGVEVVTERRGINVVGLVVGVVVVLVLVAVVVVVAGVVGEVAGVVLDVSGVNVVCWAVALVNVVE